MKKIIILVLLALVSCQSVPTPPAATEIDLNSLTLYFSRSTLDHTDFEQYSLKGTTLFRECGRVLAGRHNPLEQTLVQVSEDVIRKIKADAWHLKRFVREKKAIFQSPGGNTSFFDPGELALNLSFSNDDIKIKTSFDSISIPSAPREHKLNEIAYLLRSAGAVPPCGKVDFYGLASKKR